MLHDFCDIGVVSALFMMRCRCFNATLAHLIDGVQQHAQADHSLAKTSHYIGSNLLNHETTHTLTVLRAEHMHQTPGQTYLQRQDP